MNGVKPRITVGGLMPRSTAVHLSCPNTKLVHTVIRGEYGNNEKRCAALGSCCNGVQAGLPPSLT